MTSPAPVDALLLISTGCPHCAGVAAALLRLVKEGQLGRLEVINLDRQPAPPAAQGVRGLPWLRIGAFEFTGAHGYRELADWAARASTGLGWTDYLLALLARGELDRVLALVQAQPEHLGGLLDRLAGLAELGARIGISALVESLAGSAALHAQVPRLVELTQAPAAHTRADACHFLGLAGVSEVCPAVARLLDDEDPEVREIASETLALLDRPQTEEVSR
ncbi:MAG: HEAT repeat domain-containing protein [Chromatiaceae bacterium]|nr:MAG: HEAT repeat domain-containing protein [Chromatiaceae bacterium]